MISELNLTNFKCFDHLHVEMSTLNVLAGINSMGKSTAIQAMLLLRQAYEMNSLEKGIYLNGNLTNIGTGYNLLYRYGKSDTISIELKTDKYNIYNTYRYARESDFQEIETSFISIGEVPAENIFGDNFSYISADRIGPQRYYTSSYREVFEKKQVGIRGEYFAGYLAERGIIDRVTNKAVLHPNGESEYLIYQMQEWLSEITPGIHLDTEKYRETGIVSVEYKVETETYSPMNVGFGLSYVAPVVLALLKANPGDLIILENPEAHLHPKGQRRMGELIALTASGDVQVVVETHSDHLLNGIRLQVKKRKIDRDAVRLNYFYVDTVQEPEYTRKMMHKKCSPAIMEDGSLSDWPDGFFDEWDKALEELF